MNNFNKLLTTLLLSATLGAMAAPNTCDTNPCRLAKKTAQDMQEGIPGKITKDTTLIKALGYGKVLHLTLKFDYNKDHILNNLTHGFSYLEELFMYESYTKDFICGDKKFHSYVDEGMVVEMKFLFKDNTRYTKTVVYTCE